MAEPEAALHASEESADQTLDSQAVMPIRDLTVTSEVVNELPTTVKIMLPELAELEALTLEARAAI